MLNNSPSDCDALQGILELIDERLHSDMRSSLELTTLIGRLIARASNEAHATSSTDLGAPEIDVLAALASRAAPYRAKPGELSAWSQVTGAAITARVNQLERRGLVERVIDTKDRRIRWIYLTAAGNDLLQQQALQITKQPLFLKIKSLCPKDSIVLRNLLSKLV